VRLAPRHVRALAAIADAFAPGLDGLPSACEAGVPEAVVATIARLPRAADRRQFQLLLDLFAATGVSRLPPERRGDALLRWGDSRLATRRAGFSALRKLVLASYATSGPAVWNALGYPGPPGPGDAPAPAFEPLRPAGDRVLGCDVVVVGSGAGGGTAAGVLAAAGLDVVVLEAGEVFAGLMIDGDERTGLAHYLDGAATTTADGGIGLLAGACLGGGTVVNYTTAFRTPDDVRDEWAAAGVPAFAEDGFTAALDAVSARFSVTRAESEPGPRCAILARGCEALGWHHDRMPRNVRGCDAVSCGFCGYGCRAGAKQSTLVTYLADAAGAGARIVVGTRAERVIVTAGAARGVVARTAAGDRVTVRSRAVVVACGALQTPVLLRRSGLANPRIGRGLRVHPATAVLGQFDDVVEPWTGTMQAVYSDQLRRLDRGYGVKFETAPAHPGLVGMFLPWRSARQSLDDLRLLPRISPVAVLLRDRDAGEVRVSREGAPRVLYRLSDYDAGHLHAGIAGAARILEAAGATRVGSVHQARLSYEPGRSGDHGTFVAACASAGYAPGRLTLASFHLMASAAMGGSAATSACDPQGECWEVRDLIVCDGSAFPTSSGVNPMLSIAALAHMNASRLVERIARTA
jgi:long-chain-alcohol oxidase